MAKREEMVGLGVVLALPDVVVQDVSEVVPPALRDQDRVLEVALDLADGDIPSLGILLAAEEEVLVLNAHVSVVRRGCGLLYLTVIKLLDELPEVDVEVLHAVGGDEDLEAGVPAGKSLADFQEPTACVFLKKKLNSLSFAQ